MGRNHSPDRCPRCQIYQPLCTCALAPRLKIDTRVVIFMHFRELSLTTNTARMVTASLVDSEIRVRGLAALKDDPVHALDLASDPTLAPYVLYPSEDSEEISPGHAKRAKAQGKRLVLIVPDGNWRQGSKALKRTPGIEALPRVRIPPGPPSEYRVRISPKPEYVCTIEAIARALRVVEGEDVHDRLMEYFRIAIDRLLWARGLLKPELVRGGVPPEAIEAFRIAGMRGGRPATPADD